MKGREHVPLPLEADVHRYAAAMNPLVAKSVLPVLMLLGGGVAWSVALTGTPPQGNSRAWIDSPMTGEAFAAGAVTVAAHASAPGGVDRIELSVDGHTVATVNADGDERVSRATFTWRATDGVHDLRVRGHAPDGWGEPSEPVTIQIGINPASPDDTVEDSTTTTLESTTTEAPTTTIVESTTTTSTPPTITAPGSTSSSVTVAPTTTVPVVTAPPTTATTTTTAAPTTTRPGTTTTVPQPSIDVSVSPLSSIGPHTFTFTANAVPQARDYTIKIFAQTTPDNPTAPMRELKTCTSNPCTVDRFYSVVGVYSFRASITTAVGGAASSSTRSFLVRPIG